MIQIEEEDQEEAGVTYRATLREEFVMPGDTVTFEIEFANNITKTLYGVVISATVPPATFFKPSGSELASPQNVKNRGKVWESSDGGGDPCPDNATSGTTCIFRIGTVLESEKTEILFPVVVEKPVIDSSIDPDASNEENSQDKPFDLETDASVADLDENQLLQLKSDAIANIANPTAIEQRSEPLGFSIYLPMITR